MKNFICLLLLLVIANTSVQQVHGATTTSGINWITSYEQAVGQSQTSSKPILVFFTGSDWCGWCNRLEEEVFDTPEFASLAKDKFIFVKIDFPLYTALTPQLSAQNKQLKKRFDIRSFPTVVLLDSREQQIDTTGYRAGGGRQYAAHLDKIISNYSNYKQKVQNLQQQKLSGEELKKLYHKSKELDLDNDSYHLIKLGMDSDEKNFFLTEYYRLLAEEGQIHSPEALQLKQQLLGLDPQNEKSVHYHVAVIEFEAFCEEMQRENFSSDLAVAPLVQYIQKFGAQDKDNLWRLEMIISQVYLDKNRLSEALKHAEAAHKAAPAAVRSEIASAVSSIQSQLTTTH